MSLNMGPNLTYSKANDVHDQGQSPGTEKLNVRGTNTYRG